MKTEPVLLEQVVQLLLPILVEIDGSSVSYLFPATLFHWLKILIG